MSDTATLTIEERAARWDALVAGPRFREGIRDFLSCLAIGALGYGEGFAKASHHPTATFMASVVSAGIATYVLLRVRRPDSRMDSLFRENKRLRSALSDAAMNAREAADLSRKLSSKLESLPLTP